MSKLIKKHQAGNRISEGLTDTGTRLLNAVATLGGSAIGDAIEGVSPTAADAVEKYSLGLIPHTKKEQLMANRSNNPNKNYNRAGQTAGAITNVLAAELMGKGMQWGANKIVSGEAAQAGKQLVNKFKKPELSSHLQGEDAIKMFKDYSKEVKLPENSGIVEKLQRYVPEARLKYGLWQNQNITDDEIAKSLYKQVIEMGKSSGTKAVNSKGEPLILFRGDTQAYTSLKPKISPEKLAVMSGTMDNSLGNLFLGDLPTLQKGQGLERYLVRGRTFRGLGKLHGSGTGSMPLKGEIDVSPSMFEKPSSKGGYLLSEGKTSRGDEMSVYKLPPSMSSSGVNDINAFVVNTPKVRNATEEIAVLSDDFLAEQSHFKGIPKDDSRVSMGQHYSKLLEEAKVNKEGLLKSNKNSKFRDEHEGFDYFVVPNENIKGVKHILPYDMRVGRNWKSDNIFKSLLVGSTLGASQLNK